MKTRDLEIHFNNSIPTAPTRSSLLFNQFRSSSPALHGKAATVESYLAVGHGEAPPVTPYACDPVSMSSLARLLRAELRRLAALRRVAHRAS